ncbi:MAG: sulfite exporter TauE/SafE family protein, partial [Saprospiraceae bacterium]|nr:sulfite exporter TauE/SafE family protein [Saprospiraceae bacterium]
SLSDILISFIGGFCAGSINTLAGFGSIITLAIYMDLLGLPGHIANATNRINVMASSSVSTATFYRYKMLDLNKSGWHLSFIIIGAFIGIYLATIIDSAQFKSAFSYVLIPILVILLMNPKKMIKPDPEAKPISKWVLGLMLFLSGIYAGFIQAGFGVILLILLVMLAKEDLVKSNALKVAVVTIYTIVALIIFQIQGMLFWKMGLAMAVGQAFGGYFMARNASKMKNANVWAYRLLIVIVSLVIIKNFRLWEYFL